MLEPKDASWIIDSFHYEKREGFRAFTVMLNSLRAVKGFMINIASLKRRCCIELPVIGTIIFKNVRSSSSSIRLDWNNHLPGFELPPRMSP